ncbi:hypothetical protein XBO1_2060043 [Xenorhabdus bovienii str. oregonense]|uniref:Uncharacterized protein n=1 Tax=Xenorhabdus bovienii str. oregonense TaxID=1398202 RepID=A0A077NUH6_XENBV|nr:hypothetical protein XBO1_2060043 [Xenorhabdus bovienii str. oregonense]
MAGKNRWRNTQGEGLYGLCNKAQGSYTDPYTLIVIITLFSHHILNNS